jgi:hypothetical protein
MDSPRIIFCQRGLVAGGSERHEVVCELRALGCDPLSTDDAPLDLAGVDLVWIQGNANWYPRVCRQLEEAPNRPTVAIWHTEPLPPPPESGLGRPRLGMREIAKILLRDRRATDPYTNVKRLRQMKAAGLPDVLAVSSRARQAYLASRGIQCEFVPLGYAPQVHGEDLGLERDVDVLFLGQMVRRRKELVRKITAAGAAIRTEGSWSNHATWGHSRTELLNRTKILLNLSRFPGEFAGLRLILGMCNGAMVVSEPIYRPEPFVPGEHYIEAPSEQMPQALRYYLDHAEERQKIVERARRFVTRELTLRRSLQRILELADSKRAQRAGHRSE